jgi:Flp pilus assembly protein TadB
VLSYAVFFLLVALAAALSVPWLKSPLLSVLFFIAFALFLGYGIGYMRERRRRPPPR